MGVFAGPLDVRHIVIKTPKKFLFFKWTKVTSEWLVLKSFRYYLSDDLEGPYIEVKAGFRTDLASIPKAFRGWVSPDGPHAQAAVVHDWLYIIQDRPRKECDVIFKAAMKVIGVAKVKIKAMYRAVRAGGWVGWRRVQKRKAQLAGI